MPHIQETEISSMRVRRRGMLSEEQQQSKTNEVEWQASTPKSRGEALLKNLAVASALVLCAVTLRTGAVPSVSDASDVIMTAATDNSLLDDKLGRLSFVSALFPEAVLVFGENSKSDFTLPVSGGMVVHAWSEAEPYMTWRTDSREVMSSSDGEVIGVYHGNGDERLVQVMTDAGIACLYGNLASVEVQLGDYVSAGQVLGTMQPGMDLVFEVRENGMSIDPALYMSR